MPSDYSGIQLVFSYGTWGIVGEYSIPSLSVIAVDAGNSNALITSNYTLQVGIDQLIVIGLLTANITISLPTHPVIGTRFEIKNGPNAQFTRWTDSATSVTVGYATTIVDTTSNTIDGMTFYLMDNPYESIILTYNGFEWSVT
jgi:hypothetical protein